MYALVVVLSVDTRLAMVPLVAVRSLVTKVVMNALVVVELSAKRFWMYAFVVVEFSGVKLGQNYSGAAFNTFHDPDEPDETDHTAPDFMEDRLYNNKPIIPNAKKYIVGLSLITNGKKVNDKAIVQFIERYGDKFKFYESTESYTANKQKSS